MGWEKLNVRQIQKKELPRLRQASYVFLKKRRNSAISTGTFMKRSIGKQVRSLQFAIERLRGRPDVARLLIHKPGSLTDEIDRLDQLVDVYRRGLNEVAQLINGVTIKLI